MSHFVEEPLMRVELVWGSLKTNLRPINAHYRDVFYSCDYMGKRRRYYVIERNWGDCTSVEMLAWDRVDLRRTMPVTVNIGI